MKLKEILTVLGVGVIIAGACHQGARGWRQAHPSDLEAVKSIRLYEPNGSIRPLTETDWAVVQRAAASGDWQAACRAFAAMDRRNLSPSMQAEAVALAGETMQDARRPGSVRASAQAAIARLTKPK